MQLVQPFDSREPSTGLLRAARRYNTTTDPWTADGRAVNWQRGVSVRQGSCTGVHVQEPTPCGGPCCSAADGQELCLDPLPSHDDFRPFPLAKAMCLSEVCSDGVAERMQSDYTSFRGIALARALHAGVAGLPNPSLQSEAVDLSGGQATPIGDAIGTLLAWRAAAGVGGGWLHVPMRAAVLAGKALSYLSAGFGNVPFDRTVLDFGYPTTGPLGVEAPAGQAWLYVSGPVIIAESESIAPEPEGGWTDRRTGCWTPIVKHLAVVVWDTCTTGAVLVNLSEGI